MKTWNSNTILLCRTSIIGRNQADIWEYHHEKGVDEYIPVERWVADAHLHHHTIWTMLFASRHRDLMLGLNFRKMMAREVGRGRGRETRSSTSKLTRGVRPSHPGKGLAWRRAGGVRGDWGIVERPRRCSKRTAGSGWWRANTAAGATWRTRSLTPRAPSTPRTPRRQRGGRRGREPTPPAGRSDGRARAGRRGRRGADWAPTPACSTTRRADAGRLERFAPRIRRGSRIIAQNLVRVPNLRESRIRAETSARIPNSRREIGDSPEFAPRIRREPRIRAEKSARAPNLRGRPRRIRGGAPTWNGDSGYTTREPTTPAALLTGWMPKTARSACRPSRRRPSRDRSSCRTRPTRRTTDRSLLLTRMTRCQPPPPSPRGRRGRARHLTGPRTARGRPEPRTFACVPAAFPPPPPGPQENPTLHPQAPPPRRPHPAPQCNSDHRNVSCPPPFLRCPPPPCPCTTPS